MVKYGNLVFLNLGNFLLGKPEVGANHATGNIGGVRRDAAAGVQYEDPDAVFDALLPAAPR